jgi:hypothetical protein
LICSPCRALPGSVPDEPIKIILLTELLAAYKQNCKTDR